MYVEAKCARCEAHFTHLKIGRPRKYCQSCATRTAIERATKPAKIGHCMQCGAQFTYSRGIKNFCSGSCKSTYVFKNSGYKEVTRACIQCGETFTRTVKDVGKGPTCCSMKCSHERLVHNRRRRYYASGKHKPLHKDPRATFACEVCGKETYRHLSGKHATNGTGNRFCSRACMGVNSRRVAAIKRLVGTLRLVADGARCDYFAFECDSCRKPFGSRSQQQTTCNDCELHHKAEARNAAAAARRRELELRHMERAEVTECPVCDSLFCVLWDVPGQPDKCCSEACKNERIKHQRLASKAKRRGANKVEAVNPLKVFERAGWRCYMCGCETPQHLRGTYEESAPELEHVIALSDGGDHTYENTACACRKCNIEKGKTEPSRHKLASLLLPEELRVAQHDIKAINMAIKAAEAAIESASP